jgi:hypothetical protein
LLAAAAARLRSIRESTHTLKDINDIKYVINVDYPTQTEDYVHRIGRTARSTNTGTSFTFLTSDNARHVPKLIEVLREANQYVSDDLMNMGRMRSRMGGAGRGSFSSMLNKQAFLNRFFFYCSLFVYSVFTIQCIMKL